MSARFWAKVRKGADCWLWTGSLNNKGYGQFHFGGGSRHVLAHRHAWFLTRGSIPAGRVVMHKCDNPACVNPAHLQIGTMADNQRDMALKGRAGQRGEKSPQAKLSDDKVREIRALHEHAGLGKNELARRYGVTRALIRGVVNKTRWAHVE